MSAFFIERPIFAWVLAIMLMMIGALCITRLPITPYPSIAPPTISIETSYPGANAKTVEDSVTQIIEQNMTGMDGLLYMSASSKADGSASLTLTFANGTNPDIAQVQVQNRLQAITPLLPQIVQQQGVNVSKRSPTTMMGIGFESTDPNFTASDVSDYIATNIADPISRINGVGSVMFFAEKYAMRIWLNPEKLQAFKLTPTDVVNAIRANNTEFSVGQLGDTPQVANQQINATITAQGRLQTAEQFRNIILRANSDGSVLRLADVARVELGASSYAYHILHNGKDASGIGIILATGANALQTSKLVHAKLAEIQQTLPPTMKAFVVWDTAPFIGNAIKEVIKTLIEATILVFLVMFLFLQNWRATLIPTIAVPVVLLGTFPVLLLLGYSINMLTMFAIVLAIGLLVDDAIVVVENVERLMAEQKLSALEATRQSVKQITGALIGIGTVLSAVFLPMAFFDGATGVIYRQFSVTIVTAMVLSVLVALTLTPALCATLLKPHDPKSTARFSLFAKFNAGFERASARYQTTVTSMLGRVSRYMLVYLGITALLAFMFIRIPTAFLPEEDQGLFYILVQTPVGATQSRTNKVLEEVQHYFLTKEKDTVSHVFTVQGTSFSGNGQNIGLGFVNLKDWKERTKESQSNKAVVARAWPYLNSIRDALVFPVLPPAIHELGVSGGFNFFLKDSGNLGHEALTAARTQFLSLAEKDARLMNMRYSGTEDSPQFRLDIDMDKAAALGVSISEINDTLSIGWGGRYINDFVDRGRVKRVYVQADAPYRMNPEDFKQWYVRNQSGTMVPVSAFTSTRWEYGPSQLNRYNGVSAMEFNGEAAAGISSGDAIKAVETLAKQLPQGMQVEWTGQSFQEKSAGSQTPLLYTLSIIIIFLSLAALYESWAMPIPILMAVPLGIIGAIVATGLRGMERDIYFQVGMLTTIGLSSKNAILIVEFAKLNMDEGMKLIEATLSAVRDRLRPILMTSFAFGFGILPLALASGAGAGAQRAIGTGIFGGMIAGTLLGIFFVPVIFVYLERLIDSKQKASAE